MSSLEEMMVGLENNSCISSWSHLPQQLIIIINKFLSSPIDVTRFRSVCSSWRSSTSPFKSTFPVTTVPVKYSQFYDKSEVYHLTQKIIYRIEPLVQSSSTPTSWLIALEFDGYKTYLVNPFTGVRIETLHSRLPNQLNVCEYRFTELNKVYSVQDLIVFENGVKQCILEKALFVSPTYYYQEMLVVLVDGGTLVFYKLGTDRWSVLKTIVGMSFKDIILHRGRVYVINAEGITFVVYSDLIPKEIASRVLPEFMCPMAYRIESYFVESLGHIYLIEKYEETREFDFILPGLNHVISRWPRLLNDGLYKIKVHRLLDDEELWEEVSQLDNRVFFISCHSNWSFSAASEDFSGCKGNSIVFQIGSGMIYESSYEVPSNAGVFDVETGSLQVLDECPGYAEMYWPPPNWLNPQNHSQ